MKQILSQAVALIPVLWLHGVAGFVALSVFVLISLNISASNVASKTRAVEQRVSSLEGMTFPNTGGTVNGNVAVTGNHSVGGYITGSGGGTLENNSSIHTSGTLQADTQVATYNVNSTGSSTNEFTGGIHTASNMVVDGTLSAGNLAPGQSTGDWIWPVSHGTPWENQIIDGLNAMASALKNSGILNGS